MAKKQASSPSARWLFKEEPSHYGYADLEEDGETWWDGVENPQARIFLRQVKPGDRVLYYHTGKERAIVGEMSVSEGPRPSPNSDDPRSVEVKVVPVRRWNPVTLDQIKQDSRFSSWELVRNSRLSVLPVSPEQWKWLEEVAIPGGPQGS